MSRYTTWLGVLLLGLVLTVVVFSSRIHPEQTLPGDESSAVDILFAGEIHSIEDEISIFADLSLFGAEAYVFGTSPQLAGPDEVKAFRASLVDANFELGVSVLSGPDKRSVVLQGTQLILLQEPVEVDGDACGLTDESVDYLEGVLAEPAERRILFIDQPIFATSARTPELQLGIYDGCSEGWWDLVAPMVRGKVDLVVSSPGPSTIAYRSATVDGVEYVISGGAHRPSFNGGDPALDSALLSYLHIRSQSSGVIAVPIRLADPKLQDAAALIGVVEHRVTVLDEDLRWIYKHAPVYSPGTIWTKMIEPPEVLSWLQETIPGTARVGTVDLPIELNVRGNVGNHWETYKKSWDITFLDAEHRQVKLITPRDRGYINQMFVQIVSEALGVPTPSIEFARLNVNGHDFGIYLQYEDFDSTLLELNGFGSDAAPSKSTFRDHFTSRMISDSIMEISVAGRSSDRTEQQSISEVVLTPENIGHTFDQDYFARWIAVQLFVGDRHQNEFDNFRFFLDRSTGRYIMLTWDADLMRVDPSTMFDRTGVSMTFLANEDNRALTEAYLQQLLDLAPELRMALEALVAEALPLYLNDSTMEQEEAAIASSLDATLETFDHNVAALKGEK